MVEPVRFFQFNSNERVCSFMNHRDSSCHTLPCPINSALLLQLKRCFERRFFTKIWR
ncbi:hypothetical protein LINPERHAP1_LOCUS26167, partial [Linum perenne]